MFLTVLLQKTRSKHKRQLVVTMAAREMPLQDAVTGSMRL